MSEAKIKKSRSSTAKMPVKEIPVEEDDFYRFKKENQVMWKTFNFVTTLFSIGLSFATYFVITYDD